MSSREEKMNHDILLLFCPPGSGKSEVRARMALMESGECRRRFHMGLPTLQLDDYVYVRVMLRVDELAVKVLGMAPIFFRAIGHPFRDARDWLMLIQMLNEDYRDMLEERECHDVSMPAGLHLFRRMDAASRRAGALVKLGKLAPDVQEMFLHHVFPDKPGDKSVETLAQEIRAHKNELARADLTNKTVVMECARGGPHGASLPLDPPQGFEYSLKELDPQILRKARILYIDVTPAQSRASNMKRVAPPGRESDTTTFHTVPMENMLREYGTYDMLHMMCESDRPNTVRVEAHGEVFYMPIAVFNNRDRDRTTFVRACKDRPLEEWDQKSLVDMDQELERAMSVFVTA
jgi:hypothetical protein